MTVPGDAAVMPAAFLDHDRVDDQIATYAIDQIARLTAIRRNDPVRPQPTRILANASAYWDAADLNEQLDQATQSGAVTEQAKGILMAGPPAMGPDEAFEVLRRSSQRENVEVRDIAQRIVDERSRPRHPQT